MAIAVVDYGVGNLRSVQRGLEKAGAEVVITADPKEVEASEAVVLPGVGAFGKAVEAMKATGLDAAIASAAFRGIPVLGICLGLQLLFSTSFEGGEHTGLKIISGKVVPFPRGVKVPHIGWNDVRTSRCSAIFRGIDGSGAYYYFVHSFYVVPDDPDDVIAWCHYGIDFPAAVQRENVYGVQFHPEKSGDLGLKILENFVHMVS